MYHIGTVYKLFIKVYRYCTAKYAYCVNIVKIDIKTMHDHSNDPQRAQHALLLGLLAVTLFALTLPMSKLAIGSAATPYLSPWFIAFGRAAVAGVLAIAYLYHTRAVWPKGRQWRYLLYIGLGNALGFPILQSIGLLYVPSSHAAVFNGLLPLATAAIAALLFRQHAPLRFWFWALLGAILVMIFALWRAYQHDGALTLHYADVLIFIALLLCGYGYAYGAKLSRELPAAQVLCWMLVLFLPLTAPASFLTLPKHAIPLSAWLGFAYVAVLSMWAGMMIWYHALHIGGAVRVSQVQIIQPFLTIMFSVPLLGERFEWLTVVFAAAVVWTAYMGKKVPIQTKATHGKLSG